MKSILEPRDTEYKELEGDEREMSLKQFQSRNGWFRGGQASRLSEEEAGILAARLVRRVQEKKTQSRKGEKARVRYHGHLQAPVQP